MSKRSVTLSIFKYWHDNPPPPFNPDFIPEAAAIWRQSADKVHSEPEDRDRTREQRAARLAEVYSAAIAPYKTIKDR